VTVGAPGSERLNASTLLDLQLDAGRAEQPALLTSEGAMNYGELALLTGAVAAYLSELGVQREQRVLMILDDSPAFPAVFLGAMRIGAVPVPVNPMDRVDNYAYYLDDSYAKVLVVEASLMPALEASLAARPGLHVLVVDGDPGPYTGFYAAIGEFEGELAAPLDTHREDMAFWLYSSGSTGRPKGVVHAHGSIAVTVEHYARKVLEITGDDVCYSTTKLFHAYGLGNSLSFPLSVGACSTLVKGRSAPDRIFETYPLRRLCRLRCCRAGRR
jgi:benzoate-CoA ligase